LFEIHRAPPGFDNMIIPYYIRFVNNVLVEFTIGLVENLHFVDSGGTEEVCRLKKQQTEVGAEKYNKLV